MKNPATTMELACAIETLIASYMEGVRDAAEQAVARALARPERVRRSSPGPVGRTSGAKSSSTRRTAAALEEMSHALRDLVRAHPGTSMVELAEQLGASARELERPMARLRAEGQVRTVGQRHLMRYFPAVPKGSRD